MSRRINRFSRRLVRLAVATVVVAGTLAVAGVGAPPEALHQAAAAQSPPNVLVIETDDQTLESMRVMENVNSLIGGPRGTTFQTLRQLLALLPLACHLPHRAVHAQPRRAPATSRPTAALNASTPCTRDNNLAVWLQDAGYYTGMIGKYLNGYANDPPVPPGWSDWHAAADDVTADEDLKAYDYTLNNNGTMVRLRPLPCRLQAGRSDQKAVSFVHRRSPKPQPFFLWLTYTAPHGGGPDPNPNPPFNCRRHGAAGTRRNRRRVTPMPSTPSRSPYARTSTRPTSPTSRQTSSAVRVLSPNRIADMRRRYRCELESLLSVDEGVKKIVDALRAKRELNDTLLVYTSDNGFFHGEHRIPDRKTKIYEESIRVPLLMRGPAAGIPRGVSVGDLVTNADLAPTIVDVANADPGLVMDGLSLIPVAQQPGIEQGRELLVEQHNLAAIRTESHLYAEHSTGARELYDLVEDPFELQSRHDDPAYAPVQAQLAARLHELQLCAGPTCQLHP